MFSGTYINPMIWQVQGILVEMFFQKEALEVGTFMVPYHFVNFSLMCVKIYKHLPCMCYHQLNKSQF